MAETLAAVFQKFFSSLIADLVHCFQTVGHETRIENGHRLDPVLGQFFHRFVGIRLEPFFRAEARLECGAKLAVIKAQPACSKRDVSRHCWR